MRFNHFVHKTKNDLYYCNTVTSFALPINSSKKQFEKYFFLKGQEFEAISYRLIQHNKTPYGLNKAVYKKKHAAISFVNTLQCNLRCLNCFISHQLTDAKPEETNLNQYTRFLTNYVDEYKCETISIDFIGGETLLRKDICDKVFDATSLFCKEKSIGFTSSIISNLTVNLNENIHKKFFSKFQTIRVSLDGDAESNNTQRVYRNSKAKNPFLQTLKNLKKLNDWGLSDRIYIQSAAALAFIKDENRVKNFYLMLGAVGVRLPRISLGIYSPNQDHGPTEEYIKYWKEQRRPQYRTCCTYRYMEHFVIHGNKIHANYHNLSNSEVGDLSDSIEIIEKKYKNYIFNNMPVLQDHNCLKCSVIGLCWGDCSSSIPFVKDSPSSYCDPQIFKDKLEEQNDLVKFMNSQIVHENS